APRPKWNPDAAPATSAARVPFRSRPRSSASEIPPGVRGPRPPGITLRSSVVLVPPPPIGSPAPRDRIAAVRARLRTRTAATPPTGAVAVAGIPPHPTRQRVATLPKLRGEALPVAPERIAAPPAARKATSAARAVRVRATPCDMHSAFLRPARNGLRAADRIGRNATDRPTTPHRAAELP